MRIDEIDANFKIDSKIKIEGLKYYDPEKKPFSIYGVFREGEYYRRLPKTVCEKMSEAAVNLGTYTAGGRIRFSTDSSIITVYVEHDPVAEHPHFSALGQSGCDLYENLEGEEIYRGSFMPNIYDSEKYEFAIKITGEGLRSYTINLPSYCSIKKVYIGLSENAEIAEDVRYNPISPFVYYGSSITQGGCASRPGNSYENIICRKTNVDYINLGFAGNARGEDSIIDYVSALDMSLFVLDYDYNAPSVEHLKNTFLKFYKNVRRKNRSLPIIMMTRPKYRLNSDELARNKVVSSIYEQAVKSGDSNVYFIDGRELVNEFVRETAFVDGIHPTDSGHASIAQRILEEIKKIDII